MGEEVVKESSKRQCLEAEGLKPLRITWKGGVDDDGWTPASEAFVHGTPEDLDGISHDALYVRLAELQGFKVAVQDEMNRCFDHLREEGYFRVKVTYGFKRGQQVELYRTYSKRTEEACSSTVAAAASSSSA